MRAREGRGVAHGTARFTGSPGIAVSVGRATREEDLRHDWVMTHEMVHLGFPSLEERHHWMEEGLATYVEPLGRARTGLIPVEQVWSELLDGLPKGLPGAGDRGLDRTPTWGRTYWGGALFWFLADVEIRRRTSGRRGLDDALRAIVAEGGTLGQLWSVEQVIATADRAVGAPVLRDLYRKMATSPAPVDLDALWRSLGVRRDEGHISFDEAAPLAWVRRAITATESAARASPPGARPPRSVMEAPPT